VYRRPLLRLRAFTVSPSTTEVIRAAIRTGRGLGFGRGVPPLPQGHGSDSVETPVPVVAYKVSRDGEYDSRLMVLESVWREPLGAISGDSLKAEGCDTLADFKRAWLAKRKRYFNVLAVTTVYRLRPWEPEDARRMADRLLQRLYGDFLPSPQAEA
jgi:hypothetical protein